MAKNGFVVQKITIRVPHNNHRDDAVEYLMKLWSDFTKDLRAGIKWRKKRAHLSVTFPNPTFGFRGNMTVGASLVTIEGTAHIPPTAPPGMLEKAIEGALTKALAH